jgi:hypothetical protein
MSPDLQNGNGGVLESGWRTKENSILTRRHPSASAEQMGVQLDAALYEDLLVVLGELDLLLDCLPESKIREFSKSEAFPRYKRLLQTFLDVPADWDPRG